MVYVLQMPLIVIEWSEQFTVEQDGTNHNTAGVGNRFSGFIFCVGESGAEYCIPERVVSQTDSG